MKKLESSLLNMVLVLTGVAVIMGGILALVNHLTEGPIQEQKAKTLANGIKSVIPFARQSAARNSRMSSIRLRMLRKRIWAQLSRVSLVVSVAI